MNQSVILYHIYTRICVDLEGQNMVALVLNLKNFLHLFRQEKGACMP